MLGMLKRREVEVVLNAGHSQAEVARLTGVGLGSVCGFLRNLFLICVRDQAMVWVVQCSGNCRTVIVLGMLGMLTACGRGQLFPPRMAYVSSATRFCLAASPRGFVELYPRHLS